MNSRSRLPIVLLIVSVAVSVLSAAARIFLTMTEFEVRYGVYEHGTILPTVYHVLLLLIVAALVILACIGTPKREPDYFIRKNDAVIFLSCLTAFLLAANTLIAIINAVSGGVPSIFDILEVCFAIPALLFFFGLIKKSDAPSPVMMFTSLFPIAWCSVCLIRVYFDNTMLHTSPTKTLAELALLAAMLYFLTEARMQLGITSHRFFLATALIAPVILITNAVPNLLLSDHLLIAESANFLHGFVEIAFALFIYARLCSYLFPKNSLETVLETESDS